MLKNCHIAHQKAGVFNGFDIQLTIWEPDVPAKMQIFYYHGGGLIFGHRQDLPEAYLQLFLDAGIRIVAFDYPLAPQASLSQIIAFLTNASNAFYCEKKANRLPTFLFGRSAGAYLSLMLFQHMDWPIVGIISLYGYFYLNDAAFLFPSRHYLQFLAMNSSTIEALINRDSPLDSSISTPRFPLYVSARQTGNLFDYWKITQSEYAIYSLDSETIKDLPPLFLAAANHDPDVPTRQSIKLADLAPNATFHLIESIHHDFDRTNKKDLGLPLYRDMVEWLFKQENINNKGEY